MRKVGPVEMKKTKIADYPINTWLAQMLTGNDAAYAGQTRFVITKAPEVNGVNRCIFGGVLLDYEGAPRYEAFDGSVIFVPRRELDIRHRDGWRLDQLVCDLGGLDPLKARHAHGRKR